MAGSLDIAYTVGTWLAARLAMIALFRVLSLWLLWRNLLSPRHITLKAVDDNDQSSVSKRLRIWRDTHAFRRINVPSLVESARLSTSTRRDGILPDTPSRAGWIALLQTFQAFSVPLPRGGDLI
ncbi:hypothetical protein BU26DRAFT_49931 [Trematosphaeria pertusa]|uniref:Uncharacterized protein n=1 Tax=Trematosphaeria pertusa TaxID=390896 RepID=A0A6A6I8K8_9PLEO|nr:uncharacterized protein BU26DRAFT_49931 [Trematosphaeria pertusa]KAF2246607.1 hypothetical protein BU26DRAFT_49931 [Trematosphaeria pertusa]